ncbi:hypothetical protein FB382_004267 [Nocardioides ginsengisegetis]|uniref:PAP2 superfamily protein n=1 Tax=Nocardioides ginsengisegetis TaxID=661491 RepID=A0A7W3J419_9ACTN|nr:vanadium-dependent haloperoxidase [Nocardioides ginsengisegetis]MBA8805922.1 hypothetical protein [Nocardioides ginsengisegetis]
MLAPRACALLSAAVLAVAPLAATPFTAPSGAAGDRAAPSGAESAQVVLDWERISFRTVYTDGATPIPVGVPVLGFTSVAMYDAARRSEQRQTSSETAAVATAAHDVLLHYYPTAGAKLDADLSASLALVPDGHEQSKGVRIGGRAAADMIASRVGDHYLDASIHYTLTPGIGVWGPNPGATDMLAAWLGSLRPLVLDAPIAWSGRPDPLTSAAYATDFNEVKTIGSTAGALTHPDEAAMATFYNSNSATMVGDALIRRLTAHPESLIDTARLFGRIHAAMTDAAIRCWQLKRDVGFWRPSQAVAGAESDGNPATSTETGWTPFIANPNYSDYVSGHACLTGPAVEVIRQTFGENTPLELISVNTPAHKFYTDLTSIERDAENARVWGGLHFRKAVRDGYEIAHRTAQAVIQALP